MWLFDISPYFFYWVDLYREAVYYGIFPEHLIKPHSHREQLSIQKQMPFKILFQKIG